MLIGQHHQAPGSLDSPAAEVDPDHQLALRQGFDSDLAPLIGALPGAVQKALDRLSLIKSVLHRAPAVKRLVAQVVEMAVLVIIRAAGLAGDAHVLPGVILPQGSDDRAHLSRRDLLAGVHPLQVRAILKVQGAVSCQIFPGFLGRWLFLDWSGRRFPRRSAAGAQDESQDQGQGQG